MSSYSHSLLMAPPRSLGSGTFNEWSVENFAQRSDSPPVANDDKTPTKIAEEIVLLSGLREEDVKLLLNDAKNNASMDLLCCSETSSSASPASSQTSSPTSSVCADDDTSSDISSDDGVVDVSTVKQPLQVQFTEPDVYGQMHPVETDALRHWKLRELASELKKLCSTKTVQLMNAEERCPELVTDRFKLIFLRCECFNAEKAARRYARYWDKRVEIFGPTRAFRALTIESMEGDDMKPLELGAMQILRRPKTDPEADERDILYFDSGKLEPTQYSRESGCRAFWYFFHTLLEDEQVQKRGLTCINYAGTFANRNRDPSFARLCISSLQGCIPIRLSVFHGCHLPPIYRIAARLFLLLIGERMRKRVLPHSGTKANVMALLETKYNIPRSIIPTDMGGELHLDIQAWVRERRAAGL